MPSRFSSVPVGSTLGKIPTANFNPFDRSTHFKIPGVGSTIGRVRSRSTPRFSNPFGKTTPAPISPRQKLINEQQEAMDEAKRQTEERFQRALTNLEDVGVQERADIGTRFDSSRSAVNQSLVNSGLSGTTVLPSMQRGVERERTAANRRLSTDLAREENQLLASRNDIPPDLGRFMQLLLQQGAGGII